MEGDTKNKEKEIVLRGGVVHHLLFGSYSVYLFSVVLGVIFDLFIHFEIFSYFIFDYIGFVFIVTGSLIAYWAQFTSGHYKEELAKLKNKSYFNRGPYRYMRTPTHTGLFVMAIGLAFLINSLSSVVFTIIAHIVTKFFFIRKQEKILENKYGETYIDYKKNVKNWL